MNELGVKTLQYLVLSGDIADHSTPAQYEAAVSLLNGLAQTFGLDSTRIVVAPGNHDLNWELAKAAYRFQWGSGAAETPTEPRILAGDVGFLLRDEIAYGRRFHLFSEHFYRLACGRPYPESYSDQGEVWLSKADRLLFVALNSSWEIDHHYKTRASIHSEALSRVLDQLRRDEFAHWLKIAVFHHPVTGREMMNDDFLERLSADGFRICLHGHIHEAKESQYKYDNRRRLHIVGAGTFGAPAQEQVVGVPLQYNLLIADAASGSIVVETRRKEKAEGAWSADARWGDRNNPEPRYTIKVEPW